MSNVNSNEVRERDVLAPVRATKNQRVRGGRGVTVKAVRTDNIRFKYIPHPSDTILRHQWGQAVRRDRHHASAHAAGVHDTSPRLVCRRCKIVIPVYPQSLSDYGYNNNLSQKEPS